MSETSDFKSKPQDYLSENVVIVAGSAENDLMPVDKMAEVMRLEYKAIKKFQLTRLSWEHNVVLLDFAPDTAADTDCIKAYWLPWLSDHATSMVLGDQADFFFTSEMTNCRFSVLDEDKQHPRVAHVSGSYSNSAKRNKFEKDDKFLDNLQPSQLAKVRRLSVSGSRDRVEGLGVNKKQIPKIHEYRGQQPDNESSAFVFGLRQAPEGWKFYAQIAKGCLTSGFYANGIKDDVTILDHCRPV